MLRGRLEDVPFWSSKLLAYRKGSGHAADAMNSPGIEGVIARSAAHEIILASLTGLRSLSDLRSLLDSYVDAISAAADAAELEDAAVLVLLIGMLLDELGDAISADDLLALHGKVSRAVEILLPRVEGVGNDCTLREAQGILALAAHPGELRVDDLELAVQAWTQLVQLVPKAPLFPLERFADRLTTSMELFEGHSGFTALVRRVDELIADRFGPFAAGDKARNRSVALMRRGEWLSAASELHDVALRWFSNERIRGATISLVLLSDCYLKLNLTLAAKAIALAAAYSIVNNQHRARVLGMLPRALTCAAMADYQQGAWLSFIAGADMAGRSRSLAVESPDADKEQSTLTDNDPLSLLIYHLAVALDISAQLYPGLSPAVRMAADRIGVREDIEYLSSLSPWRDKEPDAILNAVVEQLGVIPFSDLGEMRTICWSALGVTWHVEFANDFATTTRGEEVAAFLQILHAAVASRDLGLLEVDVHLSVALGDVPTYTMEPPSRFEEERRWSLTAPNRAIPDWVPSGVMSEISLALLAAAWVMIQDISVLPQEDLKRELEWLMKNNVAGKAIVAQPYSVLFESWTLEEYYSVELRRSGTPYGKRCSSVPALPPNESPGPGYSIAASHEWIASRYEGVPKQIPFTLQRLRNSKTFTKTVERLRTAGWKDWHLLLAVLNCAYGYRMNRVRPPGATRTLDDTIARSIQGPSVDKRMPVPVREFSEEALKSALQGSQVAFLRNIDLGLHLARVELTALDSLLRRRFRYWEDDIPHEDPFPPARGR